MTVTFEKPFLTFHTDRQAPAATLRILEDGQLIAAYNLRLDPNGPFTAFLDVRRFQGKTLSCTLDPEVSFDFAQVDQPDLPGLYEESLRPQAHFTVQNGWNNDPNGLIWLDGTYHMFYQYGPCSLGWNNMHWGHATSPDLIHWTEQPVAICPDGAGMAFSGSAYLDRDNVTGLGTKENPPVLLYYTRTGPNFRIVNNDAAGYHQRLAWSTDGLQTLHFRDDGPLIPNLHPGNRDPKVSWCPELDAWVMAMAAEPHTYYLLRSDDLLTWTEFQTVLLPEDDECPDLYPIQAPDGSRKWLLSGAHDTYTIGTFVDGQYVFQQPPQPLSFGGLVYAGQTISDCPHGPTRIVWLQTRIPSDRFSQQMGIPMDLRLIDGPDGLLLTAWPVAQLETIHQPAIDCKALPVTVPGAPADFTLELTETPAGSCDLSVFGLTFRLDFDRNTVTFQDTEAPLSRTGQAPRLRLILDRCTAELFLDGGTALLARACYPDFSQTTLSATAALPIASATWHPLRSIWSEPNP